MEGTELTLRWEKFGLSRGLHEMLATKDLVDVTIACQGEYMQAHKTVLAACSSQFRKIFLANPCQHPVIFMQDSKLSHLQAVLNFMYTGEATVLQHELAGFMKTAEALKVSGLTTPAQGPGPVLHQKKPDAGVPPPKKTRTSQAQPWVNLHGMKMETPGVYIVEPGQLQASVNMDTTEISETERAVESVEAQEQVEEDQDDDHYAGGGDDDDGDPDWFDESAKEHDEGNTSQPSTSAGVSSRGRPLKKVERLISKNSEEDPTLHTCPRCSREFITVRGYQQHMRDMHKNNVTCDFCPKMFSTVGHKSKHMKAVHSASQPLEKDPLSLDVTCNTCGAQCASEVELKIHVKSHESPKPQTKASSFNGKCSICNKTFKHQVYFKKHMMQHQEKLQSSDKTGPQFKCEACKKLFKNLSSLVQHLKTHGITSIDKMNNTCRICHKSFSNPNNVKRHLKNVHGKVFPSQIQARSKNKLIKKVESETPSGEHKCRFCSSVFTLKSEMLTHSKSSHASHYVKCRFCPRLYRDAWQQNRHEHAVHGARKRH